MQVIGIKHIKQKLVSYREWRRLHMPTKGNQLIIGMTQSGKSKFSDCQMLKALKEGHPFCFMDPKGDDYHYLQYLFQTDREVMKLWELRKDKILFLNPVTD